MNFCKPLVSICVLFIIAILSIPMSYRLTDGFRNTLLQSGSNKQFLYVAQVEECLQTYHMGKDVFGLGLTHDVLVLSYKKLCSRRHRHHIHYIEATYRTTWTTGRNYLYQYIKKNSNYQNYLYYIFMDQDVRLINNNVLKNFGVTLNKEGINITKSKQSPWRKFESFLLDYRPAIGDIDHIVHYNLFIASLPNDTRKERAPYLSSFLFDAMFNAFHRDVLDTLLPYDNELELESWWASQQYLQCKIFFRYHAQLIIFLPVLGVNGGHSEYPQKLYKPKKICKKELKLAPEHIKNSDITSRLLGRLKIQNVPVFSYIAPARTHMGQYKYFGNTFLEK